MNFLSGYLLPNDTMVYYVVGVNSPRRGVISPCTRNFNYLFGEPPLGDGLYATYATRCLWQNFRYLHPHCTLYEMLLDKLKI